MNTNNDYKKLLKIVGPISFQYLMASLVSASDAFMLGFLEQDAMSADLTLWVPSTGAKMILRVLRKSL